MSNAFASSINKVALLYLANLILVFSMPILGMVNWTLDTALIAYTVFFVMNVIGVTVTFHRFCSHQSFQFKYKWVERLFLICAHLAGTGSSIAWVGTHRTHHAKTDVKGDPHPPTIGFFGLQALRYDRSSAFIRQDKRSAIYVRDLVKDRWHMNLHRYYFLFLAAYPATLLATLGADGLYFGFVVPSALTLFSENLVNWACHKYGYRNFHTRDRSTNVWWINFLSHGDGWHNNHHAYPNRSTTKSKWYELDTCGSIIQIVRT